MRRFGIATLVLTLVAAGVTAQSPRSSARHSQPARWGVWDPADSIGDVVVPIPAVPGLTQRVRLQPRAPRRGDTLYIASRVEYTGKDSVRLTTHICGYALRADGGWLRYFSGPVCNGYATTKWWSAGSSDLNDAVFVVIGQPGTHHASITDLLDPPFAAPIEVRVLPARLPDT